MQTETGGDSYHRLNERIVPKPGVPGRFWCRGHQDRSPGLFRVRTRKKIRKEMQAVMWLDFLLTNSVLEGS